jgi:hypothetical protein
MARFISPNAKEEKLEYSAEKNKRQQKISECDPKFLSL